MAPLLVRDGPLHRGTVVDRPNRFVVRVRFDGGAPESAFLADPGALEGVVEPGRPVLCSPADDPDRSTDHDAIAVDLGDVFVSVRAALANDLFERALDRGLLPSFRGYAVDRREPALPDHGRTDFRLESPGGDEAHVEVKSCTSVEDGVARFPDRQTERGRRHLRSLEALVEAGREAHVVFVVQRPDARVVRPYREVDPAFADLLARVRVSGVGVHAMEVAFEPPEYVLVAGALPVEVG